MKRILLFIMLVPGFARAEGLLSIPGAADAVAKYAKESKAIGLIDLNAKISIGGFVPIRKLHDAAGINYIELGPGAVIKQGEHFRGGIVMDFDASAIVRKLEGKSSWYQAHVSKVTLPDVWIGLYVFPHLDSSFRWDRWRQFLGGSVSIGL